VVYGGKKCKKWFLVIFDVKKCGKVIFSGEMWENVIFDEKKCGKVVFGGKKCKKWFLVIFDVKKCGKVISGEKKCGKGDFWWFLMLKVWKGDF